MQRDKKYTAMSDIEIQIMTNKLSFLLALKVQYIYKHDPLCNKYYACVKISRNRLSIIIVVLLFLNCL